MAIRVYNLLAGLAPRYRLHLLSLSSSPDALDDAAALREICERVEVLPAPVRTRRQRLQALFTSRLPDMALRAHSADFQRAVLDALARNSYDVVHVESIEMAPYAMAAIGQYRDPKARSLRIWPMGAPRFVFDDLNAEYLLQKRVFEPDLRNPRRWMGAAYSFVQWQRLARYERLVCQTVDRVVAVSDWDKDALARLAPGSDIRVVPNGIDAQHYLAYVPAGAGPDMGGGPALVFTGKMDFRPNVDAMLWFCGEILPRICAEIPDARLYIVGQRPSPAVQALAQLPGVTVTGFVPDVRPYIAATDVYVVPMRMGGGTRLKVLEAMVMGRAVVSTALGCEGYGLTPSKEVEVADDPAAFARSVVTLLRDGSRRAALGAQARDFAVSRYDWSRIVPLLEAAYGF
jgi:glycosyltransferase involved in cell wall biosynthesis